MEEGEEPAVERNMDIHAPWHSAVDLEKLVLNVTAQTTTTSITTRTAPASHEQMVMGNILFWTVIIAIISLVDMTQRTRELIVGVCGNINLLFFYAAPLSTIAQVLKERNSASIHIWTMVTNTANGCLWTSYGLTLQDPIVYVPSGLGALLSFVQVVLVILLPRKTRDEIENGTTKLTKQCEQSAKKTRWATRQEFWMTVMKDLVTRRK